MDFMERFYAQLKQQEEDKKNGLKILEDGFITTLFFKGEYRNIGNNIIVQKSIDGNRVFGRADINAKELTLHKESDTDTWGWKNCDSILSDITTASRRKIKKESIVISCFMDEYFDRMIGLVFTNEKIHYILRGRLATSINYADIEDVDFEEDTITLKLLNGEEIDLYCDDGDSYTSYRDYTKNLYNFIMDIKDMIEEQK